MLTISEELRIGFVPNGQLGQWPTGGTFIYPSNFAWLLKRSYSAIKSAEPGSSSTVMSGGLFGHDVGGVASAQPNGADYLSNTYTMGREIAGWKAGSYPLDRIGQHLYVDQGSLTSPSKLNAYLQDVRNAYVAFEGSATSKQTEVSEFGWVANPT